MASPVDQGNVDSVYLKGKSTFHNAEYLVKL